MFYRQRRLFIGIAFGIFMLESSGQSLPADILSGTIENIPDSLQLEVISEARVTFTEEYRRLNPSDDLLDTHGRTDLISFKTDGTQYRYDIQRTAADGRDLSGPIVVATKDQLSVLNRRDAHMYVKSRPNEGHGSFDGINIMTAVYSFLADDTNSYIFSPTTLSEMSDPKRWAKLKYSRGDISQEDDVIARRKLQDGGEDSARFELTDGILLPIHFRRVDSGGRTTREVVVAEYQWQEVAGRKVAIPFRMSTKIFFNGWEYGAIDVTLKSIKAVDSFKSDIFEFDPSRAAFIYDADNRLMIEVPK